MSASPSVQEAPRHTQAPPQQPRAAVLDILTYELPLDVVSSSVWTPLSEAGRRGLRQCSSLGRHLADSLITSATLDTTGAHHPADAGADEVENDVESRVFREAWQLALGSQCAFLARLPRLDTLAIVTESSHELQEVLLQAGLATSGQLTALSLSAPSVWLTSSAVRLACPRLQRLVLGDGMPCEDSYDDVAPRFEGDLYLSAFPSLQKLEVRATASLTPDALRSISNLTGLQDVSVCVRDTVPPAGLEQWTGLTHLTRLHLWMTDCPSRDLCTLPDLIPLFHLTQLQCLLMQRIRVVDFDAELAAAPTQVPVALALLGGMTNLTVLDLGEDFTLDDCALIAIERLTGLTSFGFGSAEEVTRPAAGGRLPALKQLRLSYGMDPVTLLQRLELFLPLRSLTFLTSSVDNSLSLLTLDACVPSDQGGGTAPQAAALLHVSTHLALAPHLLLHGVHVLFDNSHDAATLSVRQVAQGLQPLAGLITHLFLRGKLETEGDFLRPLSQCLPRLVDLHLHRGSLSDSELLSIVVDLPLLQKLTLSECTRGITEAGWVELATAAAVAPLSIEVDPPLSAEVVALCQGQGWCVEDAQKLTMP